MKDEEIFETLKKIIEDSLEEGTFDVNSLSVDSLIFEDIIKNSISAMYVALAIEDRFEIELDNETLKNISTVKDLIECIKTKKGQFLN